MFELLRAIYERKTIDIIKEEYQLQKLIKSKYVEGNDNKYLITDLGLSYLEKYKVDNAIIMAAGFGSRFVPYSYDTPKGLIEVNGLPMLEHQIIQLKEVGIEEIYLVVGHLKEKFEYLVGKYNVILIENENYKTMNNISSLFAAKDILKRSYVLTSDIYMPNNLYHLFEDKSWYACRYFDGKSHEWGIKSDVDNEITAISRTAEDQWVFYGPAFFDNKFSNTFIEEMLAVYGQEETLRWYWEDVVLEKFEKFQLYANKLNFDDIYEFENLEELRSFDESYLMNPRSKELTLIAEVFDVNQIEINNLSPLDKGMTNKSFLFSVNDERYVFRVPGKGTEELITREHEAKVYALIKELDISDEIVFIDSLNGYKITKYYDGVRPLNSESLEEVTTALKIIKNLHNKNLKVEHEFSLAERIAYYEKLCEGLCFNKYKGFSQTKSKIEELLSYVEQNSNEKTLIHVDPVSANFLVFPDKSMKLIDWEYAGMGDPFIDIAMHVVYDDYSEEVIDELLEIYLDRESSKEENHLYYSYIALSGYLWTLWTIYKESLGDHYGNYGLEQYAFATQYGNKVVF